VKIYIEKLKLMLWIIHRYLSDSSRQSLHRPFRVTAVRQLPHAAFNLSLSRGPCVLVQSIAVSLRYTTMVFKRGAGRD